MHILPCSPLRFVLELLAVVLLCAAATAGEARAQVDSTSGPAAAGSQILHVFLDCNARNCDFDHFRRQIEWVSWVRDREDAEVHLLVTSERTGSRGRRYTLDYIGRAAFEGVEKSLTYVSSGDDTDAEVREGLTRTMALGLVPFVEQSPAASRLRIVFDEPTTTAVLQPAAPDPWNLWVFRLSTDVSVEAEASESGYGLWGSASADRVSEALKIDFGLFGRYSRDRFELEDEDTFVNTSEYYQAGLLVVGSLGDHWSAGGQAEASHSTFVNRDLAVSLGPAVEYNIFPYDESTRRQLTFRYVLEGVAFDYMTETVEGKTSELLGRQALIVAAAVQQPWGEVFGAVEGIQYLHDPATHRINTFINLEYRLFRGFEIDIRGEFARTKDQFFLSKEELSDEEILLRRRQRETDYEFDFRIGLSYRFGSKFANIVNPRMSGDFD